MSLMNKKSFISVKWMLTIVIIIILVIGLFGVVHLFFPWWGWTSCVQLQRSNIYEVNDVIEEVLLNGEEQVIRFRVEECTKCIWFNSEDHKLEVKYGSDGDSFSTLLAWNGDIDISEEEPDECELDYLVGPKACTLVITVDSVQVDCSS